MTAEAQRTTSSTAQKVQAPIVSVTLLEDRAQVTRLVQIELDQGAIRLIIDDTTPLISDRTLHARSDDELRVDEVRVCREWKIGAEEQPPDIAELTTQRDQLSHKVESIQATLTGLEQRRGLIENATELFVDNINRQMPHASELDARWEKDLDELYTTLKELDKAWLKERALIEERSRELSEVTARLEQSSIGRPDHHLGASLELDLEVLKAGQVTIKIEYTVPCALWRPVHRATLADKAITFECEAAVWQATGEDWTDIQLSFSTARPTQRSDPPILTDDVLALRRKREKTISVDIREEAIATTGEGVSEEAEGLPGVDDGGETRILDALVRTTVRSDGRMHRVPIFTFSAEAELDRLCCPELAPLVHLRSNQTNTAAHPLLAGPLTLIRQSGYVGRSTIDFVAPGELFVIGWGSEDGLRVRREIREKRERSKLSGKQTISRTIKLSLSNLDDQEMTFSVQERIPVSEIDTVRVSVDRDETSPAAHPDDQGIASWKLALGAHSTEKIKLKYTVTASRSVQGL